MIIVDDFSKENTNNGIKIYQFLEREKEKYYGDNIFVDYL